MNLIFHVILGRILEVYIDDIVVKSKLKNNHLEDLRKVFERMRTHKLKMNPAKCVFGVQAGDFLGFLVHQRGIEVPGDKAKAVIDAPAPRNKKELQSLLGKINFLRRFISNSAGKITPFSPLLKLQGEKAFVWEPAHQEAFDRIKAYLANMPVLVPPNPGVPLKLFISASETSIYRWLARLGRENRRWQDHRACGLLLEQDVARRRDHVFAGGEVMFSTILCWLQASSLYVVLHHKGDGSDRPDKIHAYSTYSKGSNW